jgi:hypothetical protein
VVKTPNQNLERRGHGAREEQVACRRAGVNAGKKPEADDREGDAAPGQRGDGLAEEQEREQWSQDDIEARDEAGARDRRSFETGGLKPETSGKEDAEDNAREDTFAPETA